MRKIKQYKITERSTLKKDYFIIITRFHNATISFPNELSQLSKRPVFGLIHHFHQNIPTTRTRNTKVAKPRKPENHEFKQDL